MIYWILGTALIAVVITVYVLFAEGRPWKTTLLDATNLIAESGTPWTKESIGDSFSIPLVLDEDHSNKYFTVYAGSADGAHRLHIEHIELRLPKTGGDTDAIIILTLSLSSFRGQMLTLGDFQKKYATAGVENELTNISYESPSKHYYSVLLPNGTKVMAGTKTAEIMVEPDPSTSVFNIIISR